jgi:two-component system chemotaxis response regulator CheY
VHALIRLQAIPGVTDIDSVVYANILDDLRKQKDHKSYQEFKSRLHALKKMNPNGASVVICDDSLYVHNYLALHLTNFGYRVADFARDGAEGISFYEILKPDLITLDVTMPVVSGTDAAKRLFEKNPRVKILFVTGLGQDKVFMEEVKAFLPEENFRIITKPFNGEQLKTALEDFVPAVRPESGSVT